MRFCWLHAPICAKKVRRTTEDMVYCFCKMPYISAFPREKAKKSPALTSYWLQRHFFAIFQRFTPTCCISFPHFRYTKERPWAHAYKQDTQTRHTKHKTYKCDLLVWQTDSSSTFIQVYRYGVAAMYCNVLHCTALHCTALHCVALCLLATCLTSYILLLASCLLAFSQFLVYQGGCAFYPTAISSCRGML